MEETEGNHIDCCHSTKPELQSVSHGNTTKKGEKKNQHPFSNNTLVPHK